MVINPAALVKQHAACQFNLAMNLILRGQMEARPEKHDTIQVPGVWRVHCKKMEAWAMAQAGICLTAPWAASRYFFAVGRPCRSGTDEVLQQK